MIAGFSRHLYEAFDVDIQICGCLTPGQCKRKPNCPSMSRKFLLCRHVLRQVIDESVNTPSLVINFDFDPRMTDILWHQSMGDPSEEPALDIFADWREVDTRDNATCLAERKQRWCFRFAMTDASLNCFWSRDQITFCRKTKSDHVSHQEEQAFQFVPVCLDILRRALCRSPDQGMVRISEHLMHVCPVRLVSLQQ